VTLVSPFTLDPDRIKWVFNMYVYIHIYRHIYIHTYIHIYIYIYIQTVYTFGKLGIAPMHLLQTSYFQFAGTFAQIAGTVVVSKRKTDAKWFVLPHR